MSGDVVGLLAAFGAGILVGALPLLLRVLLRRQAAVAPGAEVEARRRLRRHTVRVAALTAAVTLAAVAAGG